MIEFVLAGVLNCNDAKALVAKVSKDGIVSEIVRKELKETIKSVHPECKWDANG